MSRAAAANATSLPLWIAGGCLCAGVLLFFGNTVAAVRDRGELQRIEDDLETRQRRLVSDIRRALRSGAGTGAGDIDLQSLFVAIDEMGYTVAEFCDAWPAEDASGHEQGPR